MAAFYVHSTGLHAGYVTVITANKPQDIGTFLADGIRAPGMAIRLVDRDDRVRTIIEMQQEAGMWESETLRLRRAMASGNGEPAGYTMHDGGQRIEYHYRPWS